MPDPGTTLGRIGARWHLGSASEGLQSPLARVSSLDEDEGVHFLGQPGQPVDSPLIEIDLAVPAHNAVGNLGDDSFQAGRHCFEPLAVCFAGGGHPYFNHYEGTDGQVCGLSPKFLDFGEGDPLHEVSAPLGKLRVRPIGIGFGVVGTEPQCALVCMR